jgi:hypothetical protein
MKVALAMLGSPLLAPAVWSPVADELSQHGWTVIVPATPPVPVRSPDDVMRSFLAALPDDEDLVLIPHSNASLYVPALTAVRRVAGFIFVDARLPGQDGRAAMARPGFLDELEQKADPDGLLPPWTSWWQEADVAQLFPSAGARERIEREQPRLPLSYFRASVLVPAGWDRRPGAYLAFGDTYAAQRREAEGRGWPVATLPGDHLHMLVDPSRVTVEIATLLAAIGAEPGRP